MRLRIGWIGGCFGGLLCALPALAASPAGAKLPPPPNPLALLSNGSAAALAGSLRGYLVQALPNPLFEDSSNWGHTVRVPQGIHWAGHGLGVHPEVVKKDKNHGRWRRVRVTADNLPDTLIFDLRDVQLPEPGRLTFALFLSFDTRVDFHQQNWESGVKLYDDSTRARFRLKLTLQCEVVTHLEASGKLLPDAVIHWRVLQSDLHYDNFVMEHVAGVGGEAAKVLGDAAKRGLHQFHPSLERDLIAKANAAIVKAGDSKEVRISLSKVLTNKSLLPAK